MENYFFYLKSLGKQQKEILKFLSTKDLIIQAFYEDGKRASFTIESKDLEDTYKSISPRMFHSLIKTDFFTSKSKHPSVNINIETFYLKDHIKNLFITL